MARRYVTADRDQGFLLPPDLRDWLPESELAWTVLDAVQTLELSAFEAAYRADGAGRPPYDPALMVALLLFAYCDGARSSREIERRCRRDIAYRVVCGNRAPDHVSIARFRIRHREALNGLFTQVLRLLAEAGMVKVGLVAIDGTKLRGNARGVRNRTASQLSAQIDALAGQVEAMLAEADSVDAAEDAAHGADRGDEPPPQLGERSERLAALRAAKQRLDDEAAAAQAAQDQRRSVWEAAVERGEKVGGKPGEKPPKKNTQPRVNLTDPDSKIMESHGVFCQGYNAQATVGHGQVILAPGISVSSADNSSLHPMLTATRTNLDAAGISEKIRAAVADSGYGGKTNLSQPAEPILLIPTSRKRADTDTAPRHPAVAAMAKRLTTPAGQALYRRRAAMIEPVFGQIKQRLGTWLNYRGLDAVTAEWTLACTTHNLLKYWRATARDATA